MSEWEDDLRRTAHAATSGHLRNALVADGETVLLLLSALDSARADRDEALREARLSREAAMKAVARLARAWDEGERWRRERRDLPAVLGDPNPYRAKGGAPGA